MQKINLWHAAVNFNLAFSTCKRLYCSCSTSRRTTWSVRDFWMYWTLQLQMAFSRSRLALTRLSGAVTVGSMLIKLDPDQLESQDTKVDYSRYTANISQCFMTKHCKKIEERDTLLFTNLFNKKDKYHTASFFSFFVSRHGLRSFLMLGI